MHNLGNDKLVLYLPHDGFIIIREHGQIPTPNVVTFTVEDFILLRGHFCELSRAFCTDVNGEAFCVPLGGLKFANVSNARLDLRQYHEVNGVIAPGLGVVLKYEDFQKLFKLVSIVS